MYVVQMPKNNINITCGFQICLLERGTSMANGCTATIKNWK